MILSKLHWETLRGTVPLFFKDVLFKRERERECVGGEQGRERIFKETPH